MIDTKIDMAGWIMAEYGVPDSKWVVIKRAEDYISPSGKSSAAQWLCECSCEKHTRKILNGIQLRKGETKSCGCLKKKLPDDEIIIDLYVNQNKSCKEICRIYGLSSKSSSNVSYILKRNNINIKKQGHGPDSYGWKGGKIIKGDGYYGIWNPNHERADSQGYVYEHTLVYEQNTGNLPKKMK